MSLPKWINKPPHGDNCHCDACRKYVALSITVKALEEINDEASIQGDQCWWQDIRKIITDSLQKISDLGGKRA